MFENNEILQTMINFFYVMINHVFLVYIITYEKFNFELLWTLL